jgi:hypothetical protein
LNDLAILVILSARSKMPIAGSKKALARSKKPLARSKKALASSKNALAQSKKTLAASKNRLARSKKTLARSKKALAGNIMRSGLFIYLLLSKNLRQNKSGRRLKPSAFCVLRLKMPEFTNFLFRQAS